MAVLINEIFPNPAGKDADGEFIEIFNNGSETIFLDSFRLEDESGKKFSLAGKKIDGGEYLAFSYKETGISINNSDEKIFLYDGNNLADKAEMEGMAEEGSSFSRKGEEFLFTSQITKGERNLFDEEKVSGYLQGEALKSSVKTGNFEARDVMAILIMGVLAGLIAVYAYSLIFKKEKNEENKEGYFEWRGGDD
ncbi:MAG: lamin tail domain-containing protein [Candidatus Paceibacterota bacterium]